MERDIKDDIVTYRQQKAHELLKEVQLLVDNELWNSAVSRMYYACFHIVSALLVNCGVNVKTHAGARQAFALHYMKKGKVEAGVGRVFLRLYDKRQSSDYDDFIYFTREDVLPLYTQVVEFIRVIDELLASER